MSFTGQDGSPGLFCNLSLGTFFHDLGISDGSPQVTHTCCSSAPLELQMGCANRRVCILSQGANLVVLAFSAVCQINSRKEGVNQGTCEAAARLQGATRAQPMPAMSPDTCSKVSQTHDIQDLVHGLLARLSHPVFAITRDLFG